jgi:hypothetical protein
MKTNDIKRGMPIRLTDGALGTMADGKRGNIRNVVVNGDQGSAYAFDIAAVMTPADGVWHDVELTDAQRQSMRTVRAAGF